MPAPMTAVQNALLVSRAVACAARLLEYKIDKAGEPLILHALRVGLVGETPEQIATGVLHDVVEECEEKAPVVLAEIDILFGPRVLNAVVALTRRPDERYTEYLTRVASNPLALEVKIADLLDNLDPNRLARLPAKTALSLSTRYTNALTQLGSLRKESPQ